ncbi:MAG: hypothetical protein Q9225_004313 [Loekoesia sp. 1 TL-2023]
MKSVYFSITGLSDAVRITSDETAIHGQFHLLSLPPEVRDQIYDAILDLDAPPTDPKYVGYKQIEKGFTCRLHLPTRAPQASSATLLSCNRQLHNELSQAISRRACSASKTGLTYSLDLLVEGADRRKDEYEHLSPTWTKMPALPIKYAKSIHVNFKVQNYPGLIFWGAGGPGQTTQSLMNLLSRFFAYGPTFDEDSTIPTPPDFVEELIIEVLLVEDPQNGILDHHERRSKVVGGLLLLDLVVHSGLLAGKLGKISICVDGAIKKQWVVTEEANVEKTAKEWSCYGWISS